MQRIVEIALQRDQAPVVISFGRVLRDTSISLDRRECAAGTYAPRRIRACESDKPGTPRRNEGIKGMFFVPFQLIQSVYQRFDVERNGIAKAAFESRGKMDGALDVMVEALLRVLALSDFSTRLIISPETGMPASALAPAPSRKMMSLERLVISAHRNQGRMSCTAGIGSPRSWKS